MKSEETYKYQMRPGYGTNELLIDFITDSDNENFINELKELLLKIDYKVVKKDDLVMNEEILYTCKSKIGEFQISSNNYGCVFITSEVENCIIKIDELLQTNKKFVKSTRSI